MELLVRFPSVGLASLAQQLVHSLFAHAVFLLMSVYITFLAFIYRATSCEFGS